MKEREREICILPLLSLAQECTEARNEQKLSGLNDDPLARAIDMTPSRNLFSGLKKESRRGKKSRPSEIPHSDLSDIPACHWNFNFLLMYSKCSGPEKKKRGSLCVNQITLPTSPHYYVCTVCVT